MNVTLSASEVRVGASIGIARRIASFGSPDNVYDGSWTVDAEGACAEMAFAKLNGRYWDCHVGTFKAPDVGGFRCPVQVRTAEEGLCLTIRPDDPDDHVYVLMLGKAPTYRFAGWIRGSDAKALDTYVKDPRGLGKPAWFIPEHELNKKGIPTPLLDTWQEAV